MNSRQIISAIEAEGWYEVAQKGSHKQFRHPTRTGKTTIPVHGSKDVPLPVVKSIEKQSGVSLR
jgi:predicted RNA binding protein YcfA (HicA-like mRNA interferase family)